MHKVLYPVSNWKWNWIVTSRAEYVDLCHRMTRHKHRLFETKRERSAFREGWIAWNTIAYCFHFAHFQVDSRFRSPSWNLAFVLAAASENVGIYTCARYKGRMHYVARGSGHNWTIRVAPLFLPDQTLMDSIPTELSYLYADGKILLYCADRSYG